MAKCQRCGRSGFLLHTTMCEQCRRAVCSGCLSEMSGVKYCFDCRNYMTQFHASAAIQALNNTCPLCDAKGDLQVNSVFIYRRSTTRRRDPQSIPEIVYDGPILHNEEVQCRGCGNLIDDTTTNLKAQAVRAERAGRYEDAAQLYEQLNFLSTAKALRERNRSSVHRMVQVDLNRLLEQVRQGDLIIPYKCPSCGAGIKITKETSVEKLANCPYCGNTLVVADLEKFLGALL